MAAGGSIQGDGHPTMATGLVAFSPYELVKAMLCVPLWPALGRVLTLCPVAIPIATCSPTRLASMIGLPSVATTTTPPAC